MKALVLGGCGFIGSHLVDKLTHKGHYVKVLDQRPELFRNPVPGVSYVYGDYTNKSLIKECLSSVDCVFHLITTTTPKTSNEDPEFDVHSNLVGSISLLTACVELKVKKFVYLSSGGTVYGTPSLLPVTEDERTNPLCSYGITKLAFEKYLLLYQHMYGLQHSIIRPSNPYGERQNPYGMQGAVSIFLRKILEQKPIDIWGDGTVSRDYIYISDLVDAVYLSSLDFDRSTIFNVGTGEGTTLNDLIKIMRLVTNRHVNVVYHKPRVFDVKKIYLDISAIKSSLEWGPSVSLQSGIKKTWEYLLLNP
jgi:UDP-glucose 4-epimerase